MRDVLAGLWAAAAVARALSPSMPRGGASRLFDCAHLGRACAAREGSTGEECAGQTLGGGRGRSGTLAIYAVRRRFSAFGVRTRLGRFADMSSRCSGESLRAIFSDRLRSARALAAGSAPSAFQSSVGASRA